MDEQHVEDQGAQPEQSTIAVVSAVLGLASLFIGIFAAVPAVILGHFALFRIGKSAGRLTGRGLAIFALVTAYLTVGLFAFYRLR